MAQEPQEFHFVAYSATLDKGNTRNLTSIRRHVMYDYIRKQGKDTAKQISVRTKPAKLKRDNISNLHRDASDTRSAFHIALIDTEYMPSRTTSDATIEKTKWLSHARSISIDAPPGSHRSDPFDSFPVKQIPDDLINWFPALYDSEVKNASWIHRSNVQWAQNIWHSSTHDQGLFYTVLAQAERNRMIMTHSTDKTRYLYLRGQAIQALRKRVSGKQRPHAFFEPSLCSIALVRLILA